jgi:hypothetical protein
MAPRITNIPEIKSGNKTSRALGIICILISAGIIVAGLWPFEFNPGNNVALVQNEKGIRFYGQGIVFGQNVLAIHEAASRKPSFTIELILRPQREVNNMVSYILTLYNGQREQFILGQWKKELIIRAPVPRADGHSQYREISIENILEKNTTHLLAVTSSQDITDIYIDGSLKKSFPHFSLIPKDQQQLSGNLILGNSPEGTNPWNGTLFGLSIYDCSLPGEELHNHFLSWQQGGQLFLTEKSKPLARYLFDDYQGERIRDYSGNGHDLLIPAVFHSLRKVVLSLPGRNEWLDRWNIMDITVNVFGFVPFGFFLYAWLRQGQNIPAPSGYGLSILLGFCLSLGIELAQAFIPGRDSSLMDVLSNTIGTAAGAYLGNYALPFLRRVRINRA